MARPARFAGAHRDVSFSCPKCESRMGIKESRPTVYQGQPTIRRRRVCLGCGHRLTTYETAAAYVDREALELVAARAQRLMSALHELLAAFSLLPGPTPANTAPDQRRTKE